MLYYLNMPLSPLPAEPQTTEASIETPAAPIETPVLEAVPTIETAPIKEREVYVEGEPLPTQAPEAVSKLEAPSPAPTPVRAAPVEIPKDPIQKKIDDIFERNVADAFGELQPLQQEAFRVAAETAAASVHALLSAPKLEPTKIRAVVAGILQLLPETNPWWVEQEAALKTEALVALRA